MSNIGKQVIVYDRYRFAVPVEGIITGESGKGDSYKVDFSVSNPGGQNVTKHSGGYFLKGQCQVKPQTWQPKVREFLDSQEEQSKDTNPKDAIGITKLPFSTISGPAMGELGLAMLEGALKYGRHNYRAIGIRYSVYFDAAMRHIWSWWEGEDIDPDSGLPHIVKAMACLMILRDATIQGKYNDDRPPKTSKHDYGKRTWVDDLNARTKALREKYPDPKKPYTEGGKLHERD